MVELSLNSITGLSAARTMKLLGTIKAREVSILVDSGASHNFIASSLLEIFGLEATPTRAFGVQIGNGKCIQSNGVCRGVRVEAKGVTIEADFFPFDLGRGGGVRDSMATIFGRGDCRLGEDDYVFQVAREIGAMARGPDTV